MKDSPFDFTIGCEQWIQQIKYFTTELNPDYWKNFKTCTAEEIATIERETKRTLPDDFKEFLRVFGYGSFIWPYMGAIYDPEDLIGVCYAHFFTFLQSGDWASPEEQRQFYVSRGAFNPAPDKFTPGALMTEYGNLLDLMQIGPDGLCGYHIISVSPPPRTFGYGMLDPGGEVQDESASFSEGLQKILSHHWRGLDEDD